MKTKSKSIQSLHFPNFDTDDGIYEKQYKRFNILSNKECSRQSLRKYHKLTNEIKNGFSNS